MKISTDTWDFNMADVKGIKKTTRADGKVLTAKVFFEVREGETFSPEILFDDPEVATQIVTAYQKYEW